MINALVPEEFNAFIEKWQSEKEQQVIAKKQLKVKWVTEIAEIIKRSKQISSKQFRTYLFI